MSSNAVDTFYSYTFLRHDSVAIKCALGSRAMRYQSINQINYRENQIDFNSPHSLKQQ